MRVTYLGEQMRGYWDGKKEIPLPTVYAWRVIDDDDSHFDITGDVKLTEKQAIREAIDRGASIDFGEHLAQEALKWQALKQYRAEAPLSVNDAKEIDTEIATRLARIASATETKRTTNAEGRA